MPARMWKNSFPPGVVVSMPCERICRPTWRVLRSSASSHKFLTDRPSLFDGPAEPVESGDDELVAWPHVIKAASSCGRRASLLLARSVKMRSHPAAASASHAAVSLWLNAGVSGHPGRGGRRFALVLLLQRRLDAPA